MKKLCFIIYFCASSIASAQTVDSLSRDSLIVEEDTKTFYAVEQQAEFPGGIAAMMKFLRQNLNYPKDADKIGLSGKVFVKFIVETDGSISEAEIMKGVDESLNAEVIRVIGIMPKWNPGKQNGRIVRSQFVLPIYIDIYN